ncbi:MAG: hypothetical protein F4118_00365 [Acidimicrobiaceae bacterium]|nr:hypothetical protein [Acidimicrobiaceae bacterium]
MYLPEPNDVELLLGRLCRFLFTGQYRDDVDFANAMMTYNRRPEWLPPLKKRFTYYPNGDLYLCHGADELIWNTTNGLDYAAMARRRAENIAMLIEDMNRRERNITYSIPSLTPITGDVAGCQSFMDFMGQTLRDYDEFVRGRLHTEDGWLIDLSYEAFQRAMHETDSRVQMQRHWDATGGENGRTEEQDPAFDEFIQSIETFLDDDDTEEYDDDTPIKAAPSA